MRLLYFLGILLAASLSVSAQSKQSKPAPDTIKKSGSELGLDNSFYKKLLNVQFGSLVTGLSKSAPGNYISTDIKETEASATVNNVFKNGSILTLKVSGGVSDGLLSIFSNSTLNSKISTELIFNTLNYKKTKIAYYEDSYREYVAKKRKLNLDFSIKQTGIKFKQEKNSLTKEQKELYEKIDTLEKEKKDAEDKLKKLSAGDTIQQQVLQIKIQNNNFEIDTSKKRIEFITESLSTINDQETKDPGAQQFDLDNWRSKELKKIQSELEIAGFKFGWFTIAYKIKKADYKLYDPLATIDKQILDSEYVSHELRLQYNYYNFLAVPNASYFLDGGLALGLSDNFDDLTKRDIEEHKNIGNYPGDREIVKKYNAYEGAYKNRLKSARFYADAYKFFFRENALAIHLFPEFIVKDYTKPMGNLGVGLFFSLKDAKDETSIVNTELYYKFIDLFDNTGSDKNTFERNDIGIRFTFPIKFKTK